MRLRAAPRPYEAAVHTRIAEAERGRRSFTAVYVSSLALVAMGLANRTPLWDGYERPSGPYASGIGTEEANLAQWSVGAIRSLTEPCAESSATSDLVPARPS
jgi:hypothetical protein